MAKILTSSDSSLCVQFGDAISEEINDWVRAFALAVEAARFPGVVELVPTYRSVTVHYRPEVVGYARLYEQLTRVLTDLAPAALPAPKTVSVPVLYGGAWGPDLGTVAALHGLSEEEGIARHTAPEYRVYMLGFLPGFCYLGGLDERLATPRLSTPRVSIPAGSVGIAGAQTGVYPLESPGGWQLIGRTPLRLYDPHRAQPILLEAGMQLRFCPIDRETFERLHRENYPKAYARGGERP